MGRGVKGSKLKGFQDHVTIGANGLRSLINFTSVTKHGKSILYNVTRQKKKAGKNNIQIHL